MVTKWNPYTDFYDFLNYGVFNDGGDCYGFSSTAILYFRHYELGDTIYPFYPEATSSVSAMAGQTGRYCFGQICLSSSDTLYQSTFPIYIHQSYQYYDKLGVQSQPTLQSSVALLKQSIEEGVPVLMALGPNDGHAVVAWGYSSNSNGSMTIDISDPNFGNVPRYATYDDGVFSYVGSYSWSSFFVVTPGVIAPGWFSLSSNWASQWGSTVDQTNPYYNFVFADGPVTIESSSGLAYFNGTGNSLTFSSTIQGAVGFEEGSMQAYAIPKGVQFTINDPSQTTSTITIVVPQNSTSIVGYQLSTTSATPLNIKITPTDSGLTLSTASDIQSSVSLFTIGQQGHSLLTAAAIPIASSQRAVFSVPNWGNLNNTSSAPTLQIYQSASTNPIGNYTLANGQQGLPQASAIPFVWLLVVAVAVIAVAGVLVLARSRRKAVRPGSGATRA